MKFLSFVLGKDDKPLVNEYENKISMQFS
jgi:hypothetical protein